MAAHIEHRDDRPAPQRIARADLGDAVDPSPPRPQAADPASGGRTTHLTLKLEAHPDIRVLHDAQIARDAGDEERGLAQLQPALASALAQSPANRCGLDPILELGDPLALPRRLAVHRVLERLEQLLDVGDPGFQRLDDALFGLVRRSHRRLS